MKEKKPLVCVPVVATTGMQLIQDILNIQELDFQVIELRIDFYEYILDTYKINNLLNSIYNINKLDIIFTYRSKIEGGNALLQDTYLKELIRIASQHPAIQYVDVENSCACKEELIEIIHENKKQVILSNHDFHQTPSLPIMNTLLETMAKTEADILKIAYMPKDEYDVLNVMHASLLARQYGKPVISMSMGPLGAISRLVGEFSHNYLTFAMNTQASAPGQIHVDKVNTTLDIIHQAMKTN